MHAHNSTELFAVLITFACIHTVIFIYNFIKSSQISLFKIDKVIASTNSILSILPAFVYATILIADNENQSLTPFFIEWTVSIPLLLINLGKLLHFNYYQYALITSSSVAMTLTGLGSANTTNTSIMFVLFSISSVCYMNILIYLFVSYIKYIKRYHNEANVPSQLSKNNVIVFRLLFGLIATVWNGYPVGFILWKTELISMEHTAIIFVCLDFISKGVSVLTLLAYKYILYNRNGF